MKRGSGKEMFGVSLFRPSRQSNIPTAGEERFKYPLPWENKISQMTYHRANKDNQIPTPWNMSTVKPGQAYPQDVINEFVIRKLNLLVVVGVVINITTFPLNTMDSEDIWE